MAAQWFRSQWGAALLVVVAGSVFYLSWLSTERGLLGLFVLAAFSGVAGDLVFRSRGVTPFLVILALGWPAVGFLAVAPVFLVVELGARRLWPGRMGGYWRL
ncbi:MAG TPA: hypothetical protein VMM78_12360 [Thermomicrobiales bacterium]|nr:hypothetical protein [Thermomicrobiales bacterium]